LAAGRIYESFGSDVAARGRDAKILIFGGELSKQSPGDLPVIQGLYPSLPAQIFASIDARRHLNR
jgi:hypothetical protein